VKSAVPIVAVAATGAMLAAAVQAAGPARLGNVYYEDIFTNNTCNGTTIECRFYSSTPTPTDAFVRIKHAACQVSTINNGVVFRAKLQVWNGIPGSTGATALKEFPLGVPQPILYGTSSYVSTIDNETTFLVGAGRYIALDVMSYPGNIETSGLCGITGDLIPPQ